MSKLIGILWFVTGLTYASVEEAWRLLAQNQFPEARTQFAAIPNDTLAEIGWFLTFTGNGPTQELEEAALTILRRNPHSGASEFVLKWMDGFNECLPQWPARAGAVLKDLQTPNPELKVFFANTLRLYSREFTEPPRFEQLAQDAGFLTRWKVSTRFGNQAIPAFVNTWPPEKADYWLNAKEHLSRTGVFLPPRSAQGSGVFYALGGFENPVEQEITLRLFSYQNIVVTIDGREWARFPNLEKMGPSVVYLKGKLGKGRHEILIKSSQTKANNGQFSIQVSGAKPVRLVALDRASFDMGGPAEGVVVSQAGLLDEIAGQSGELADFVRATLLLRYKDEQQALVYLEPLINLYQESKLIGGAVARIYIGEIDYLPQDMLLGRAYQYLSKLAMLPRDNNLENLLTLALLLQQAQQKKESMELVNGVIQANPNFCDALETGLLLAHKDGLADIQRQTIELLEKLGPDHRWAQIQLLSEARREGDLEQTRALFTNLSKLLPWEGYVAQLHEMDENYGAAIEDLKKRWAVFDDRDYYPMAIAEAYGKLGDHGQQRLWLEKTLEVNPGNREAILKLVDLDCLEGKMDDTRSRLETYLQLEPGDAFFRQRLSHLDGKTAFEDFRVDASKVIEEAKNKPITAGADSELLLDQMMVRLFPDGSQMRYTHLVTRVLTKKGVDNEGELNLNPNLEILELRTIKPDGTVFYPADIEHKNSISLSGLGVGDFIDEEHIEYIGPAYYDADGLNAEMTFIFQAIDRVYHHSELVLVYPADLQPEPVLISANMPSEPEIQVKNGMKSVRWLTKNQPPLLIEPSMPSREYSQATATFYYNTTWKDVHDFYYDAVRGKMGLSNRVLAQVKLWQEKYPDPLELARHMYQEVMDQTEIGDSFFGNINLVWETRQGNPTLLLAAMYEALGLQVDVVFVQPYEMRYYDLGTPLPSYNYALLRLTLGDQVHWIDPNQKGVPFGYIPFPYRQAKGMVLTMEGDLFTTIPNSDPESERAESSYHLFFRTDGGLAGMGMDRFHGSLAGDLSEGYKRLNQPEIQQRVEAGVNQDYPGSEVSEVSISPDLPRGEFEVRTEFSHPSLGKVEGDGFTVAFPLPKTRLIENYGSLPTRKMPVLVRIPHFDDNEVTLMAPEGYSWQATSWEKKEEGTFGQYTLSLTVKSERELVLKRKTRLPAQMVKPEAYAAFQTFLKTLNSHERFSLKAVKNTH